VKRCTGLHSCVKKPKIIVFMILTLEKKRAKSKLSTHPRFRGFNSMNFSNRHSEIKAPKSKVEFLFSDQSDGIRLIETLRNLDYCILLYFLTLHINFRQSKFPKNFTIKQIPYISQTGHIVKQAACK